MSWLAVHIDPPPGKYARSRTSGAGARLARHSRRARVDRKTKWWPPSPTRRGAQYGRVDHGSSDRGDGAVPGDRPLGRGCRQRGCGRGFGGGDCRGERPGRIDRRGVQSCSGAAPGMFAQSGPARSIATGRDLEPRAVPADGHAVRTNARVWLASDGLPGRWPAKPRRCNCASLRPIRSCPQRSSSARAWSE